MPKLNNRPGQNTDINDLVTTGFDEADIDTFEAHTFMAVEVTSAVAIMNNGTIISVAINTSEAQNNPAREQMAYDQVLLRLARLRAEIAEL